MAWHIPEELMNHTPLPEEEVRRRYEEKGFTIIKYNYVNNRSKLLCYDSEGYKVKVPLDTFHQGTKVYARFSPEINPEGFMYNIEHYRELNPGCTKVVDWKYVEVGKDKKKQVRVKCLCEECGEPFWISMNAWKKREKTRCNKCVNLESSLELEVRRWLEKRKIIFIRQYKFSDCKNKRPLPFDFYLPNHNICIEVDGEQHFNVGAKIKKFTFLEEDVQKVQHNDNIKTQYCLNNNIKLVRLPYWIFRIKGKFEEILKNELTTNES